MLTLAQLKRAAKESGSRSLADTETDVLLTHLLELAVERGLTARLAFKGGTMLRKMVFGDAGRISTDLGFTCVEPMSRDDLSLLLEEAFQEPYRGIEFSYADKDWYETGDGCGFSPRCRHPAKSGGIAIKVQASLREWPLLVPVTMPQADLPCFGDLGFRPSPIPCLRLEEVVAEKVRAASERSKGRDLYGLAEIARNPACSAMDKPLVRSVAALKLLSSGKIPLAYEHLARQLADTEDDEVAGLQNLLRRDARVDLGRLTKLAADGFRFLADPSPLEAAVVGATARKGDGSVAAEALVEDLRTRTEVFPGFEPRRRPVR